MAWEEEVAPQLRRLRALEERNPTPLQHANILRDRAAIYAREPVIDESVSLCVTAHRQLVGDRHMGPGGYGSLPFSAVMLWAEANGFDREAGMLMFEALQIADGERAKVEAAKAALNRATGKDRS